MNIIELYNELGRIINRLDYGENPKVEVVTNDNVYGAFIGREVASVFEGFGCDNGRVLIRTKEPIYTEDELKLIAKLNK